MNPIDEAFALVLFHPTILQVRKLGSLVHFDHCVFWLNGNPYELTPAGRKLMQNAHENYVANPGCQQRPIYAAASLRWSGSLESCASLWASAGQAAVRAVS
jgi:hypothetical protein